MFRYSPAAVALLAGCMNEPPSQPLLHIEPEAPDTTATLTAVLDAEALDLDGDEPTYAFTWSTVGGSEIFEGETLDPAHTNRGERWTLTVVASDQAGDAPPARVTVEIHNALPQVASIAVEPGAPTSLDTLFCSISASDPDADELDRQIAWLVNGENAATGEVLEPEAFAAGDTVACTVLALDGHGGSASGTSAAVTIGGVPPVVDAVAIEPVPPRRGAPLYAEVSASDVDGDLVSLSYVWSVNGIAVGSDELLEDDAFERGDEVVVIVTPDDGVLTGMPYESDPVVVVNAPPALDRVTLAPEIPEAEDPVVATIGTPSDPDGDAVTVSLSWTVNGVPYTETGSTLTVAGLGHGDIIAVKATPHDGFEAGTAATDSVVVDNQPPTLASATLTASVLTERDTVGCTAGATFDSDGDPVTVRREWLLDGVVVSTASSLGGATFDRGDTVACRLTPNDGFEDGASVTSASVVVSNAAPTDPDVIITPAGATTGDTITCTIETPASDPDGDFISYSYVWTYNGAYLSTSDTVTASVDGTYVCEVTATDGFVSTTPLTVSIRISEFSFSGSIADIADATIENVSGGTNLGLQMGAGDVDGDGALDLLTYGNTSMLVIPDPLSSPTVASAMATLSCTGSCGASPQVIDVDGTGIGNVVVAGASHTHTATYGGAIWLLPDSPSGSFTISTSTSDLIYGTTSSGYLGNDLIDAGDLDGDGWNDLAMSASRPAAVYIAYGATLPGGVTDIGSAADVTLTDTDTGFGATLATCDADDDGTLDLLVGHYQDGAGAGAAYLFLGPIRSGTSADADTIITGSSGSNLGQAVVCANFGGSSTPDFAVTALDASSVYVFEDPGSGTFAYSDATATIVNAGAWTFGASIAAGDFDGDGLDDLMMGDRNSVASYAPGGEAFVFFGGGLTGSLLATDAELWMSGEVDDDWLGSYVLAADADEDGLSDMFVSASNRDGVSSGSGTIYVVTGR